jgi:ureidoglycolate amidohydrolase
VREDAVGNTFARWAGTDPAPAPVATGSHIDAIPNAGRFDGVVGILGGLEAIRALQRTGCRPRRSIQLVMFTAEEPTRFGLGCLGSRLMAGTLSRQKVESLRDPLGLSVDDVCAHAYMQGSLESTRLQPGCYDSFVELHIEQGPLLERKKVPIGVVTAIAAPAALRIDLTGPGGHAGTVLMPDRHDPSLAAAEIMQAVELTALDTQSRDTVATCGLVQVLPGAVNSIPREVRLEIDVRDIDGARRDGVLAVIRKAAQAAAALGLPCQRMISRAYHDSLFMAQVCPAAMVFVPSKDGISHRPDEYTSPEEITKGVRVLAGALAR